MPQSPCEQHMVLCGLIGTCRSTLHPYDVKLETHVHSTKKSAMKANETATEAPTKLP